MTQQQNWKISSLNSMHYQNQYDRVYFLLFCYGFNHKNQIPVFFNPQNFLTSKRVSCLKVKLSIVRQYVIFTSMLKPKTRKLQSNQKLNTKLTHISQAETPTQIFKKTDSFSLQDKEELQTFTLNIIQANQTKDEYVSSVSTEKSKPKLTQNIKLQQIQKKVKERQQLRKNKGLAVKMKIKLEDQIKTAQRQLEEKESQLKQVQSQIQMLRNLTKQRTKHSEDIANNQQMLRFKESQLTNLNTIHSEIVESAKKQLAKQKLLKIENQQRLQNANKKLKMCKEKWNDKQNRLILIQQLTKEKNRIEKLLEDQKKADEAKLQVKADAIREVVEQLIKTNRKAIEDECQWKARIIREKSQGVKSLGDFKLMLEKSGVPSTSYYTFSQLKAVKQLNFKVNKQSEKIFQILQNEISPKIIEISEHYEEPKELIELKLKMKKIQEEILVVENELKSKEAQVQQLQIHRNSLASTLAELKKKPQTK